MLRAWRYWMRRQNHSPRRTIARFLRVEQLEERAVPAFVTAPTFSVGWPGASTTSKPIAVASGDFNNDGKLDVATANQNSNSISVLLGNGTGGFGFPIGITARNNPVAI